MKVAVIGSRKSNIQNLDKHIPKETTEILLGSTNRFDACAMEYAMSHYLKLSIYMPDYRRYSFRRSPLIKNDDIIEYADRVIAFWSGKSDRIGYVIKKCKETGVPIEVHRLKKP